MKPIYKKVLWISGVLLILIFGWAFFLIGNLGYNEVEENEQKFSKKEWMRKLNKREDSPRHYMVSDLKKNHLKIGTDSNSVKQLLGEPDTRRLGFAYNMGIYDSPFDPTFLILGFDNKGQLTKINIETI